MMGADAGTVSPAGWLREGFLGTQMISTDSQMKAGWVQCSKAWEKRTPWSTGKRWLSVEGEG